MSAIPQDADVAGGGDGPTSQNTSLHQQAPAEGKLIVEFDGVHKTFGSNKVLRGLTLPVPEGKITFVIGRSGEGKSVLIKHIVGILKPDKGRVVFDGVDLTKATEQEWAELYARHDQVMVDIKAPEDKP